MQSSPFGYPAPPPPPAPPSRAPTVFVGLACLAVGLGVGFGAGVLSVKAGRDFFIGLFESEERANSAHPKAVERPSFRFEHPGNWSIDITDGDYDADHNFSIESPGDSFVMFQIADAELDLKDLVDSHATLQTEKLIKQATQTRFTKWGAFEGEGVLLKGRQLGITPGSMRIFAFQADGQTYTVIESTFDEDRAKVQPGFDLIARTFRVKTKKKQ